MARLAVYFTFVLLCVGCAKQSPTTSESGEPSPATVTAEALTGEVASSDIPAAEPSTKPAESKPPTEIGPAEPSTPAPIEPHTGPMPVYVTPFYNSDGPQISVGDYSKELTEATADSIGELTTKMKMDWATLSPEAMYVSAIRLYDLGQKDDAVYWFYAAQFRARLFQSLLVKESIGRIGAEGFERTQAHGAFHTLAGTYINGYAFGDLAKLQATIERVKDDNQTVPELKKIYPRLVFVEEKDWPEHREEIAAGLDKLVDYIKSNADMIKAKRKENGVEGKY